MKLNLKIKIIILLGFLFYLSGIMVNNNEQLNNKSEIEIIENTNLESLKLSAVYSEPFIHIDGNWTTAASYEWCSGDGSWKNPYTIENVTTDASGSPTGIGIFIDNSQNDYFIIKNCIISGSAVYKAATKLWNIKMDS